MKRVFCVMLTALLMLSLCACGESEPKGLQVGYARVEITPQESVPLAGYGKTSDRMSQSVLDYLYATCIAFTEGDETVLLFTQDLIRARDAWTTALRQRMESELGVPGDHIMICSTHTHSAPDTNSSHSSIQSYQLFYFDQMVMAAKKALEDRAPATLYGGRQTLEGMNFVRHYVMAAGNQNTGSKIPGENHGLNNQAYGEKLGQYAIDLLPSLTAVEGSGILVSSLRYEGDVNHDDEDKSDIAANVVAYAKGVTVSEANAYARKQGLSSFYQANAIMARLNRPLKGDMEINAVQIGGMAFVTAPYEMFADHAVYIKENSPYDLTMVFSCANEAHGYIPTVKAYEYGCYESFTSYFAKGTGESAAEKFVEMLNGLKATE